MTIASPALPRLALNAISHSYGDLRAVDALSLEVAAGECVSLLGPSGSGKSTTLAMIAGFLRPEAGEIRLDGRPLMRTPPHRRNIGVVTQDAQLLPHLTVAGNVAFPLRMRNVGRAARDKAVGDMLGMLRLGSLAARMPHELSGGQVQRTAFARALVFAPAMVLLDEPFGALDRLLREEMQLELRALQRRLGIAVLHVTHDQGAAMTLSDRIAVIEDGRLRQIGTPGDLYDTPADAFVARFLGENNRLPGRVEELDDDIAVIRLPGGALVEAVAVGVAPGHRCVVAIRPERVALAAVSAAEMGDSALPAILREITFHGDHHRLLLDLAGFPLVIKRPAGAALAGLRPGAEVAVAWQGHHARAFRPEAGA